MLNAVVDQRDELYDALFRGELPYQPIPEKMEVGIAGLYRLAATNGRVAPIA